MAEDTARALGAASADTVTIAGQECQVRPLTIKELTEIERECLKRYKRSFIETYVEASDLLPEGEGKSLVREKIDEAARWDVTSLPPKYAYDADSIKITDSLKNWLKENIGYSEADSNDRKLGKGVINRRLQRLAAYALDSEMLTPKSYKKMTGEVPRNGKVGYVNWWITGTYEGMITMIWTCFKQNGVTQEDIASEIGQNPELLSFIAREIERVSAPEPGNG